MYIQYAVLHSVRDEPKYSDNVHVYTCTNNSFLTQEELSYDDPDRKMYHLCIVNLVIG